MQNNSLSSNLTEPESKADSWTIVDEEPSDKSTETTQKDASALRSGPAGPRLWSGLPPKSGTYDVGGDEWTLEQSARLSLWMNTMQNNFGYRIEMVGCKTTNTQSFLNLLFHSSKDKAFPAWHISVPIATLPTLPRVRATGTFTLSKTKPIA